MDFAAFLFFRSRSSLVRQRSPSEAVSCGRGGALSHELKVAGSSEVYSLYLMKSLSRVSHQGLYWYFGYVEVSWQLLPQKSSRSLIVVCHPGLYVELDRKSPWDFPPKLAKELFLMLDETSEGGMSVLLAASSL